MTGIDILAFVINWAPMGCGLALTASALKVRRETKAIQQQTIASADETLRHMAERAAEADAMIADKAREIDALAKEAVAAFEEQNRMRFEVRILQAFYLQLCTQAWLYRSWPMHEHIKTMAVRGLRYHAEMLEQQDRKPRRHDNA